MTTTSTGVGWTQNQLIDPLLSPSPSEETGPNSRFRSSFAPIPQAPAASAASSASTNSSSTTLIPRSISLRDNHSSRASVSSNHSSVHRPRGRSLTERFPGDMSHRPLDMLRADDKNARRAPHLRRKQLPTPDSIDRLDKAMQLPGSTYYHHEGPFDATLASRNVDVTTSPLAAVARSNEEALRATPRERIVDAVERHMPLDGVASVPSGWKDGMGRVYEYDETNLNDEGEGIKWTKSPKKGHRERSDGLNDMVQYQDGNMTAYEMQDQSHKKDINVDVEEHQEPGVLRRGGSKRHSLDGLKRRIGSLRKRRD